MGNKDYMFRSPLNARHIKIIQYPYANTQRHGEELFRVEMCLKFELIGCRKSGIYISVCKLYHYANIFMRLRPTFTPLLLSKIGLYKGKYFLLLVFK